MVTAYDTDLDRNAANFQPLTPLSFLARAAVVYPDVTAIVRVRDWFGRHLPLILPAVLEVLTHPTIDTAIKAAGQVAQSEAARRSEP